MLYQVTFEADMDDADIGAMNEYFQLMLEKEMHITCSNLEIKKLTVQN